MIGAPLDTDGLTEEDWSVLRVATMTTVAFGEREKDTEHRLVSLGLIEPARDEDDAFEGYRATEAGEAALAERDGDDAG